MVAYDGVTFTSLARVNITLCTAAGTRCMYTPTAPPRPATPRYVADVGLTNAATRTREFDVLSACVALALGMLANTVDRPFGLRYRFDNPVERMRLVIDGAVGELLRAADSLPCLALHEAAAVVAARVAALNP